MLKILVAEDEYKSREALLSRLRAILGEQVILESAGDGTEAVSKALQVRPRLIFMDIEMPYITGLEAAAILQPQLPDCQVVFLTAYDRFDYAVEALRCGGMDYLLKPVSEHDLRELLRRLFGEIAPSEPASPFATALSVWVRNHYREDATLEDAAQSMGMSSFYFSRQVKAATGKTFLEYFTAYRIDQAKRRLTDTDLSICEVGRAVGYFDANYFAKVFKRATGLTPSAYRSQAGKT